MSANKSITILVRLTFCILSLGLLPLFIIAIGSFNEFIEFITADDL